LDFKELLSDIFDLSTPEPMARKWLLIERLCLEELLSERSMHFFLFFFNFTLWNFIYYWVKKPLVNKPIHHLIYDKFELDNEDPSRMYYNHENLKDYIKTIARESSP